PYDLADQPPEGDGMIPVRGSRSPPWWLGGERRAHRVPVVERFVREHVPDGRQPGTMSQEPSHRQCGLVRGGELGPVAGYRRVEVETAFRDQAVRAERRHALGAGGDVDERVALPGLRAVEVRVTAPQVDDGIAPAGPRRAGLRGSPCRPRRCRAHRAGSWRGRRARPGSVDGTHPGPREAWTWDASHSAMRPPVSTDGAPASPGRVIRPRLGDVRNAFGLTAETAVSDACGVRAGHAPAAGQRFAWLRFLHQPLAAAGLLAIDPSAWPLYLTVLIVLTCEWPFHLQLAEGIEIYPPAEWTSASAAYVLGFAVLPVFWLSAT